MTIEFAPTRIQPAPLHVTSDQLDRVVQEYELQTAVMGGQQAKGEYGVRLIIDLYRKAYLNAEDAFRFMVTLDPTTEYPAPYDTMWRQWAMGIIEDLLNVVHNAARLGAKSIAVEIGRTLYFELPEPRRHGLLWRLFFGEE